MSIEKVLNTRIQLKYDSYANWDSQNPLLKSGEVAIAYLTTAAATAPGTGDTQHPVMFKVGPGYFKDLPWASALAADVHAWAKKSETEFLTWVKTQINGYTKDEVNQLLNSNSTADKKHATDLVNGLNVTDTAKAGEYVSAVSESKGKISVTRAALPTYTLTTGSANGTVSFNNTDVAVKGLGSAAYKNTNAFDAAGAAATAKSEAIADAEGKIATAKSEAIADAASKYATKQAVADAQSAANSANAKIDAFMSADAKVEDAIDTLVELNAYITEHTNAFTGLSNKVTNLENGTTAAKEAEHADTASGLDADGVDQVKGIKVNNAVNADKLGNVAAADYLKKSEAPGYNDILTKSAAASAYQPKGNYATAE